MRKNIDPNSSSSPPVGDFLTMKIIRSCLACETMGSSVRKVAYASSVIRFTIAKFWQPSVPASVKCGRSGKKSMKRHWALRISTLGMLYRWVEIYNEIARQRETMLISPDSDGVLTVATRLTLASIHLLICLFA